MEEVLDQQRYMETYARRKFPYDPSACTLYMDIPPRQLLFACLTCDPLNAICYSCGLRCHADHKIVELYTKRAFRCDCGTTRFGNNPRKCTLRSTNHDDWPNEGLNYCHNFKGKFCVCNESVDDASYGEGAMFQCILGTRCSEDWFHARCIINISREEEIQRQQNTTIYSNDDDNDDNDSDDNENDILSGSDDSMYESGDELDSVFPELPANFGALICPKCAKDVPKLNTADIILAEVNGYLFLREDYGERIKQSPLLRSLLFEFPFLGGTEPSYTPERDTDDSTMLEAGGQALSQLPHENVVEGMQKFNAMQDDLVNYVKQIAGAGRAITKADVESFFKDRM